MPDIAVIRPDISIEEREKRIREIELVLSKIYKIKIKLVDKNQQV